MRTDAVTWHDRSSRVALILLWVVRILFKPILSLWPSNDFGIAVLGRLSWVVDRITPTPRAVHVTQAELGGVPGERIISPKPVDDPLDDATILYFHGGGFIFCGPSTHRQLCVQLALDSGADAFRQSRCQNFADFNHDIGVARIVLHRPRLALHMHQAHGRITCGRCCQRTRLLQRSHVVDHRRAGRNRLAHHDCFARID